MAAAAAGGCLRRRGTTETARVTGGQFAGRERADEARAPGVWHGQRQKEQACRIWGRENEMRSTGCRVALMMASVRA